MKWPWSKPKPSAAPLVVSIDLSRPMGTTAQPKGGHIVTFATVLSDIGKGLKKFFTVATEAAEVSEPFVDVLFPGVSTLYNATVTAVANAEAAAVAAGSQSGTGAQKLALVVKAIDADFQAYAKAQGIKYDSTVVTNWVNFVVAGLNALPKL